MARNPKRANETVDKYVGMTETNTPRDLYDSRSQGFQAPTGFYTKNTGASGAVNNRGREIKWTIR